MAQTVQSTQQYVNIANIADGIVITKTGQLRKVIEVMPVNFSLKSEQEQQAMVGQYQTFINSLNFPLQIVLHSRRLDLHPYLSSLEKYVGKIDSELLKLHANEYIEFIKRLTSLANIMEKRFYIVVGFEPGPIKQGVLSSLFGTKKSQIKFSPQDYGKFTKLLQERVQVVIGGLSPLGMETNVLNTQGLIELFYRVYNPEESQEEQLTDVSQIESPIIGKTPQPTNEPHVENKATQLNVINPET
ncbi:hypothetical protein HY065_01360 [Candidatus Berkelbacteria bacterium]|nr:hypothetical protein [Candidatus Berkelbacteria bacterium]